MMNVNVLVFLVGTLNTNVKIILAESANPVILTSCEFTYQLGKLSLKPNIQ